MRQTEAGDVKVFDGAPVEAYAAGATIPRVRFINGRIQVQ